MEEQYNINTLVIVGSWNKHIFSEDWIKNNILGEGDKYSIQYPLNALGSLKFTLNDFSFYILGERLMFQLKDSEKASALELIRIARKIFQKLIYTPVRALGVNFVYKSSKNLSCLGNIETENNGRLITAVKHEIVSSELSRIFKITDNESLNFKVRLENEINIFDINFNYDVKCMTDILDIIGDTDDLIISKRDYINSIITEIYDENGK